MTLADSSRRYSPCHDSLNGLKQRSHHAGVITREGLCTIVDLYPGPLAKELVIGTLIDVLKSSPSGYVINENDLKLGSRIGHVVE